MKNLLVLLITALILGAPVGVILALGVAVITVNLNLALIAALGLVCYLVLIAAAAQFLKAMRQDIEKPTGSVVKLKKR